MEWDSSSSPLTTMEGDMGFMERRVAEGVPGVLGPSADTYLASLEGDGRALTTRYEQWRELRQLATEYPDKTPGEFSTMDVERFLAIRCHGCSPSTRRKCLAVLSGFFGYLAARQGIDRDPTLPIRRPKLPEPEPTFWTGDEVRAILAASMEARDHLLLETLARTGQRLGVVRTLRWKQVRDDLKQPIIEFQRGKGGRVFTMPMAKELLHDFIVYRRMTRPDPEDWVFMSRKRGPLSPQQVNRIIEHACRQAGVRVSSAHEFRRSAITNMLHAGVPFDVVSRDIAGHKNPQTTMRHYRGSESERVREALRGLPY